MAEVYARSPWQGGKGGGASDVRQGGQALTDRVIVAGGGGGNAGYSDGYGGWQGGLGGAGGGLQGADGTENPGNQPFPGGGFGGTQSNGGAVGFTGVGGGNYIVGTAGQLGIGGNGAGEPGNTSDCGSAGSGGGGYYGGGGGGYNNCGGGGGGGGSSFIGGVANGITNPGVRQGDGMITISWEGLSAPECNAGCTNPLACNYDDNAEIDDNSCILPDGCTDPTACNYDDTAQCDDGSCVLPDGCTDDTACNYEPNALCDDGSCAFVIDCAGVCGGTFIDDLCGNCYDPNGIGQSGSQEFSFSGNTETWIVPDGVTQISITAFGGQGGSNGVNTPGGLGGEAAGDLTVTPGETIYIYVGGSGDSGGFNGGGVCQGPWQGGKGGGASDVRQGGQALTDRVIVAGGGGGNAGYSDGYGGWQGGLGGAGGGLQGADGTENPGNQPFPGGGFGGTQSNGGAVGFTGVGGGNYIVGTAGQLGIGGNGAGEPGNTSDCGSAGSGGGGYYGGGGGGYNNCGGGGGGGGSSFIGGVANGITNPGVRQGDGMITISWEGLSAPECNAGCTNPLACNFDDTADIDDGSCLLPDGCNDPTACNYDINASCNDGSCIYPGCNDNAACNFDPNAGCDDGSCIFEVDCAGTCGGTFIEDACGNCYDPNNLGQSETLDFAYTGSMQTWVVPDGVTQISITAFGGQGGSNGVNTPGGLGGEAAGDLTVTPGETIYIYVGGSGDSGGFNGGGVCQGPWQGGKGGGASDVRQGGQALTDRVIVAGGGGGNAGYSDGYGGWQGGLGGAGGGLQGADGTENPGNQPFPGGGFGGTQSNGGAVGFTGVGGGNYIVGAAGQLGIGGNGAGEPGNTSDCGSAGSGGGGYYGGGGGGYNNCGGGGGGGGSSFIGGVANGITNPGVRQGDGMITISWQSSFIPECDPGCTDPEADNFDPEADADDGSCIFSGCTDQTACNYDAQANEDDGSCILPDGCTDETACNYNDLALCDDGSCIYAEPFQDCEGNCLDDDNNNGICDELEVYGCTYENAENYNPNATVDDGTCTYAATEIVDCMNPEACNYNANATVDSGNCFFPPAHYDCNFTCLNDTDGDGVCDELEVDGCTDPEALNFVAEATDDDGSCQLTCASDLNGDLVVNSSDLLQFLGTFGQDCP